jgi:hypothetical protein
LFSAISHVSLSYTTVLPLFCTSGLNCFILDLNVCFYFHASCVRKDKNSSWHSSVSCYSCIPALALVTNVFKLYYTISTRSGSRAKWYSLHVSTHAFPLHLLQRLGPQNWDQNCRLPSSECYSSSRRWTALSSF